MTLLEVRSLRKSFGSRAALKGVSFHVEEGEIFTLIGPNGAGKTTLLRLINLLDEPSSGSIVFHGIKPDSGGSERVALRRSMGMVFQSPVLFNTTVYENVAYGLKVRGLGKRLVEEKVNGLLDALDLQALRSQNALTLSGGEKQRVALARVLVYEPKLLLLDEPTANLDPPNVKIIEEILRRTNETRRTTIIMATHNLFQAKRLAHRVALLMDGQLVEVAGREEFFLNPRDPRTRAFIKGEVVY